MTPWVWGVGLAGLAAMVLAIRRWGLRGGLAVYGGGIVVASCLWPFLMIAGHLAGADPGLMGRLRAGAPSAAASLGGAWALIALPVLILALWATAAGRKS